MVGSHGGERTSSLGGHTLAGRSTTAGYIARLAALVPRLRAHLTRYHGVFAPHSRWRAEVIPAGRGIKAPPALDARTPAERHRAMTWAQRLKRVFGIEIETCVQCGGKVRVIASIEDPAVIAKILGHVATRAPPPGTAAG